MDKHLINELLKQSLYAKKKLTEEQLSEYNFFKNITIRSYCPFCNDISTFTVRERSYLCGHSIIQYIKDDLEPNMDDDFMLINGQSSLPTIDRDVSNVITLSCTINESHQIVLFLQIVDNAIIKVGQYPSIIDLQRDKKGLYKQLPDKYSREMHRAIGLFSHGIGVGSFVYLRRVFEHLVLESYKELDDPTEDEKTFLSRRMEDRISYLKDFLPSVIVEQRKIFGILSKGIHEMEEEECLQHFMIIKESIEWMLQEHLNKKLSADRMGKLTAEVNKIHKELQ
ncbi:MAG: hypothetical protein M0R69_00445 [Candidatus Cloacimonetes bacterium]|jgi:hypothetical protein|nr:hypothetical protein [Candidatus Cloacimonadota bacterium]